MQPLHAFVVPYVSTQCVAIALILEIRENNKWIQKFCTKVLDVEKLAITNGL
jgi:hypothetical protein